MFLLTCDKSFVKTYVKTGVKIDFFNGNKNLIFSRLRTCDNATYAVPGGILSQSNHNITLDNVWPYDLHIVLAYPICNG